MALHDNNGAYVSLTLSLKMQMSLMCDSIAFFIASQFRSRVAVICSSNLRSSILFLSVIRWRYEEVVRASLKGAVDV